MIQCCYVSQLFTQAKGFEGESIDFVLGNFKNNNYHQLKSHARKHLLPLPFLMIFIRLPIKHF